MKLSICTDIQTIDVIVAILTVSDKVDLKPKFRKFLNRLRQDWGKIIERSKLVRNQICSTLISAITGMIATKSTYESDIYEIIDRPLEIKVHGNGF